MSAIRLGSAMYDPLHRGGDHRHNARRALIVRRHRAMMREAKVAKTDHAGSPDAWLEQLPSSLVGE